MDQRPSGELSALLTDLYQLTMAACYFDQDMQAEATFSLFIRKYPAQRNYFVAAGLSEVLEYLETLRFTDDDLAYLASTGLFPGRFLDFLQGLRFTGEVQALPEGSIFFADEPILEVSAPIIEAQLVETFIINAISLQTMIATKASRSVQAAAGRPLVDFSLRRTQGRDAGLKVARASYLAGFLGTSNVLAGKLYGIPIFGTMAHSYITSFPHEIDAFRVFARNFPTIATLLIDTYDNISGARHAVTVAQEMEARGQRLDFVRLDSGDMAAISQEVRRILDDHGLGYVRILASGSFDEYKIARVLADGARIDAFAVGTKMGVSADAPYFDIAYKLVRYADQPVMKLSTGKVTLVDKKQVWRWFDASGRHGPGYHRAAPRGHPRGHAAAPAGDGERPDHPAAADAFGVPGIFPGPVRPAARSPQGLKGPHPLPGEFESRSDGVTIPGGAADPPPGIGRKRQLWD